MSRIHFASTEVLVLFCLILANSSIVLSQESHKVTVQEIWSKLGRRQQEARTAKLSWTYQLIISGDSVSSTITTSRGLPSSQAIDAKDLVMPKALSSLSLSGDRVRYESQGVSFAARSAGKAVDTLSAFDGTWQQRYSPTPPEIHDYGSLLEKEAFNQWGNIHLLPLFFALRPLRPEAFGPRADHYTIDSRPVVVQGRDCILLRSKRTGESNYYRAIYVDIERGFVPLRVEGFSNDKLTSKMEIRYDGRDSSPLPWVPSAWTSAMYYSDGTLLKLIQSSTNELREVALNVPIPDEEF